MRRQKAVQCIALDVPPVDPENDKQFPYWTLERPVAPLFPRGRQACTRIHAVSIGYQSHIVQQIIPVKKMVICLHRLHGGKWIEIDESRLHVDIMPGKQLKSFHVINYCSAFIVLA